MLLCEKCVTATNFILIEYYAKKYHRKINTCPECKSKDCLIEIDDMLIHPISIFWKNNIQTEMCCSGHTIDGNIRDPFLTFSNKNIEELNKLRDFVLLFKEDHIDISEISSMYDWDKKLKYFRFFIMLDRNALSFNFIDMDIETKNYLTVKFANFLLKIAHEKNLI